MRIGLSARGNTVEDIVAQAESSEADGFTSLWFGSITLGDPLVAMAIADRETSTLEFGTSILQTYTCHPLVQANRTASVANAMGRGMTLGVGPSHESLISGVYGLSYDHPGRNTEEYVHVLSRLLRGETVDFDGHDWVTHNPFPVQLDHPVPLLISAMSPHLLRVAGELADGTITFLAQAAALETHVVPAMRADPSPGSWPDCPLQSMGMWPRPGLLLRRRPHPSSIPQPNYQRILAAGGCSGTADAAIVGDEKSVKNQLQAVIDAGATDVRASPFAAWKDPQASLRRTHGVLQELLN